MHFHLVRRGRDAVVFEAERAELETVFGCAIGGREYALGQPLGVSPAGYAGVGPFALGGGMVAYGDSEVANLPSGGTAPDRNEVLVRNLRTGRVVHRIPTGPSEGTTVGRGPTDAVVVKPDGSVAWIAGATGISADLSVRALDRNGERLLAEGEGIDQASLRLEGSTASWMQNGARTSARLD
jgi:hypothetical protein